jgi:GGDEF domain-containing protein
MLIAMPASSLPSAPTGIHIPVPEVPFGARRPRPVADLPPAALADGEAVAKGWLLALVAARPLRAAAALPTADFARDAPALCAAVLRALGSDAALAEVDRLAPCAGAITGATGPAEVVGAVAALRSAAWEALTTTRVDAPTTAAIAERLAHVCDALAVAALGATELRVHDARGDWRAAIARLLAAARPFAVLAVEAGDAARVAAADPDRAAGALARMEEAALSELRPGDVLGREGDGRLWVIAADLGGSAARAMAERLADAIAAAPVPLAIAIGVAASPADGVDAEALTARADEALFAARAAGVPIA